MWNTHSSTHSLDLSNRMKQIGEEINYKFEIWKFERTEKNPD